MTNEFFISLLERELGAALVRTGVATNDVAEGLAGRLEQAKGSADGRLSKIAADLQRAAVSRTPNKVAHGGSVSQAELAEFESAVLARLPSQHGALGMLAVVHPADD